MSTSFDIPAGEVSESRIGNEIDYAAAARHIRGRWKTLALIAVIAGAIGAASSYVIKPTFTARTTFLSPQQAGGASAALAQLGALAGLAGAGVKTPADQYATLLQSETITDRLIDRFKLLSVYDAKFRVDARLALSKNTRINVGKKDNLIAIEVDDHDPDRAAKMANAYVDELRALTNGLALTEAQQRRVFFEKQMKEVHTRLADAQAALQKTGFNPSALRADPKSAAESYARAKAQVVAIEMRLQAARSALTDNAPEIRSQQAALAKLQSQLTGLEAPASSTGEQDYVGAYREFKYQEVLFEIISRQYELAKLDEAKEGAIIQTVDIASTPERRSKPKRTLMTIEAALFGVLIGSVYLLMIRNRRHTAAQQDRDGQSPTR